jgi:20S proteasome alpha/beta subunit
MTYIAAFRCQGGVVMCADTLETRGEHKNYVEKIEIVDDLSYPLAIGGAGVDDILKPFMQELIERVKTSKPATKAALQTEIKATIKTVYENDVPALVVKKQHLTPQFLIAAKPTNDDYCIFAVIGKRLYKEQRRAIIGYPSTYNQGLLERLHRDDLPMQQAVMLAIYLVSQSKRFDEGVGGDTQIVIVRDNGAWIDDPEYVKQFEIYVGEFLKLIDPLFLNCVDVSIPPDSVFPDKLKEFGKKVTELRYSASVFSSAHMLNRTFHDPTYKGEPYPKVFLGAKTTVFGDGSVGVTEETKEEIEARRRMMREATEQIETSRAATAELERLIAGRKPLWVSNFTVTLQPNNTANLTSAQPEVASVTAENTKALPGAVTEEEKGQQ